MRVLIAGAGAMGSMYGGFLARGGHEVHFVDQWAEHVEALADRGLTVGFEDESFEVRGTASTTFDDAPVADLVMIWCKSFSTAEVMARCAGAVGDHTIVCSLQNGLGNPERIAVHVDPDRIVHGVTAIGARFVGPAHVEVTEGAWRGTSPTHVGGSTRAAMESARLVADVLGDAGVLMEATEDVDVHVWNKLAMAAGMSGVSALTRSRIDQVVDSPDAIGVVDDLTREVAAVAQALGIPLDAEQACATNHAVYRTARGHSASMWQDVQARRRTEIDALSGAVVEAGRRVGVATPVNETVARLVRTLESHFHEEES